MALFTRKSNNEAAYNAGVQRAERALRDGNPEAHQQLLDDHNAHPETKRGFRDRLGRS